MKKRTFLYGAAILTVSGIISKIFGALFRIPLANLIGAEGMAYYNGAYPIYVLLLTISIAGIPVAISRMVSERVTFGDHAGAHRIFKVSLVAMAVIGAVLFTVLYFGAPSITGSVSSLGGAVHAMRAIAPALFFVSILSVFRGYYQGMQDMKPSAVMQVVEQFFRVIVGLSLAFAFVGAGKEFAAAGATFGATAGAAAALAAGIFIYFRLMKREGYAVRISASSAANEEAGTSAPPTRKILSMLAFIAVPITIGATIMPIMQNIDLLIVTRRLADMGLSPEEARSLYGQLTGMAGPLINLPQVVTQGIAVSLVPTVVAAFKTGDRDFLHHNVTLSVKATMIVALPCTVGLAILAEPVMKLLYFTRMDEAVSAAPSLFILAFGVVFLASVQTLTGVLQGVERQLIPVRNLFIGAGCKAVLTYALTGVPSMNIKGAAIGTVCAYTIAAVLNFAAVRKYTGASMDAANTFGKPLVCSLVMGAAAFLSYVALLRFFGDGVSVLGAVAVGIIVYAIMIFVTRTVTETELALFPKGEALVKIYRKALTLLRVNARI
ncbi:MAG: polysaccharide biosynthesis protein [Clostridiales Family XIII bacterium]|jgi:stage V sporulation protein B|nr:polysaccharide biosynthesis protein [Clostridiales Family XIII bacterium]